MNYQLESEFLQITLSSHGAELTGVTSKEGIDYLWCADKKYWERHSPVLFPIVGKVFENEYEYETKDGISKKYALPQHGFARDSEFQVTSQDERHIEFTLESSETTKEKYPFDFSLKIIYELERNAVKTSYVVENKSEETMYFAIGAHPGFNWPLTDDALEDYYIEFEKEEVAQRLLITPEAYLSGEVESYPVKQIALSKAFFEAGTTVLTNLQSEYVVLKSKKSDHSVTVTIKGFPFLGIWSPETGAPFVCIEPWIGHADYANCSKDLRKKQDFVTLEEGKNVCYSYTMRFK